MKCFVDSAIVFETLNLRGHHGVFHVEKLVNIWLARRRPSCEVLHLVLLNYVWHDLQIASVLNRDLPLLNRAEFRSGESLQREAGFSRALVLFKRLASLYLLAC